MAKDKNKNEITAKEPKDQSKKKKNTPRALPKKEGKADINEKRNAPKKSAPEKKDAPAFKVSAPQHKRRKKTGAKDLHGMSAAQKEAARLISLENKAEEKKQARAHAAELASKVSSSEKRGKRSEPPVHLKSHRHKGMKKPLGKLKVMCLGGLMEIGKNMTVIEYENDIVVVDCGLAFPDEEMPGVDLVIPDVSYLIQNADRVRGIFITHGHEDHIGAIPYVLQQLRAPIYGTRLSLGIIEGKLEEHSLPFHPALHTVEAGETVTAGAMRVEFIHVNHSIADACALAIHTPLGIVYHSGDFKLDVSPIDGQIMDLVRIGELGKEGVKLLLCESTNAERAGFTPSERKVGKSLEYIFTSNKDKRIVIATFSSNVHRVQQIINVSAAHGRKVAITGRSMLNIVGAAVELGYMNVPEGVLVDINEIRRYKPEELTLVTTGSQGEPMSALYRMAFGDHSQVTLGRNDLVVLSSSAIPGNEKLVGRIINELSKNGVSVLHDAVVEVHVSGHACQEELKLMQALTRPKYFMPIHGEYRHLAANRELALDMGVEDGNIFISDIGKVLEIDSKGARFSGTVPAGKILVDGYGVGDVGNIVLRDRRHLAQDGIIIVVAAIDADEGLLVSGPDIVSRGFVYVRESEELMDEVRNIAAIAINRCIDAGDVVDRMHLKNSVKDDLSRFLYSKTKRKPMVLPVIVDV